MPKIEFEKYERECDDNLKRKVQGRPLIYDFRVMIDGEHRATIRRKIYSAGYVVQDPDGHGIQREITLPGRHGMHEVPVGIDRQSDFAIKVRWLLDQKMIPTLTALDQQREERRRADRKRKADQLAQDKRERLERHGPQLAEALEELIRVLPPTHRNSWLYLAATKAIEVLKTARAMPEAK